MVISFVKSVYRFGLEGPFPDASGLFGPERFCEKERINPITVNTKSGTVNSTIMP
jgi:hypothetical protein